MSYPVIMYCRGSKSHVSSDCAADTVVQYHTVSGLQRAAMTYPNNHFYMMFCSYLKRLHCAVFHFSSLLEWSTTALSTGGIEGCGRYKKGEVKTQPLPVT